MDNIIYTSTQNASFPGADGSYTCNYFPDVEFAKYGDRSLKLQIIKPECEKKKFPLIVYVKGSSWLKQKVYKNIPKLASLASFGFVIAQVEYRESPEGSYADKVCDTKAAIRFMRAHAEEYNVDSQKVALFGDSSGGHIALMASLTKGKYNNGLYKNESEDVSCVADFYGVTDIVSLMRDFYHVDDKYLKEYLKITFFQDCDGDLIKMANEISPVYNVHAEDDIPPILIVHGDADKVVGYEQSEKLAKVLSDNGKKVYLCKVAGADHDVGVWGKERTKLLADFFNAYLRNGIDNI